MPTNSDEAKLLFDEWKYRHETLWKTIYRHIWYLVLLVLLPIIAETTKLGEVAPGVVRFFCQVRQGGTMGWIYWSLVAALFLGATWHLIVEHVYFKRLENRRRAHPVGDGAGTLSRRQRWRLCGLVLLWLGAWGGFFGLVRYYLKHLDPSITPCEAKITVELSKRLDVSNQPAASEKK